MELWDLVDADRNPLGRTHVRGTPIAPGEYHVVVTIWVVDSQGRFLLTLRDPGKEGWPGLWECTGGSPVAGEASRDGAVRELWEETGIEAAPEELILLGAVRGKTAIHDVYLLRRDVEPGQLTLQPGETVDAKKVTLAELYEMEARGQIVPTIVERFHELWPELEKQLL